MGANSIKVAAIVILALAWAQPVLSQTPTPTAIPFYQSKEISNGRLFIDGNREFLVTAWTLTPPWVTKENIPIIKAKGYNALIIFMGWRGVDRNADGVCDDPYDERFWPAANELIDECWEKEIYCIIHLHYYAILGSTVPPQFWDDHPEAQAVDDEGNLAWSQNYLDDIWAEVPSIHNSTYVNLSRTAIKCALERIDNPEKVLYFKLDNEPQFCPYTYEEVHPYTGYSDYSEAAQEAYAQWGGTTAWPPSRTDTNWNQFRAEAVADWVNGWTKAVREVIPDAWIAVDLIHTPVYPDSALRRQDMETSTHLCTIYSRQQT